MQAAPFRRQAFAHRDAGTAARVDVFAALHVVVDNSKRGKKAAEDATGLLEDAHEADMANSAHFLLLC